MTNSRGDCIGCGTELNALDDDPNRTCGSTCARCIAEEAHDFDAEPDATFSRSGQRIQIEVPRYKLALDKMERLPQRQDGLNDQLRDLRVIANHFGLYDAADFLRTVLDKK